MTRSQTRYWVESGRQFCVSWLSVVCDSAGCKAESQPRPGSVDSSWDTASSRLEAQRIGWTEGLQGRRLRDYCPRCSASRKATVPAEARP